MRQIQSLSGSWELCHFDGYGEVAGAARLPEALDNQIWLNATVPGSVYQDLANAGWIGDVVEGCNTLAAQWVEQQYWYYRRRFDAPQPPAGGRAFLVLEQIDLDALIFLNGELVGAHHNFHRPCRIDVTDKLRSTGNELIARVDAGLIAAADQPHGPLNTEVCATLTKRARLRKPQFVCRWDWSPRLMNVGLGGDVRLETCDAAYLESLVIVPVLADDHRRATVRIRAHIQNVSGQEQSFTLDAHWGSIGVSPVHAVRTPPPPDPGATASRSAPSAPADPPGATASRGAPSAPADPAGATASRSAPSAPADPPGATASRSAPGTTASSSAISTTLPPGPGEIVAELEIEDPALWWPRPHGPANLYTLHVSLRAPDGRVLDESARTFGVRSVRIDQPPASDGGTCFHLLVNGERVFCKGACWVPPHLLYPLTRRVDYDDLVRLAVENGFNFLRVWGGGLYAPHALLDACDRAGLLVWHDFAFACSKYPADDAFLHEVEAEARHVVRDRSPHPSLAVWCGNNELELGLADGWIGSTEPDNRDCLKIFHERIARIVADEDAARPYIPTTPWTPGSGHPNSPRSGTQHPWWVGLGPPKGDYWEYRQDASRFVVEGGMLAPSTLPTLHRILPEAERFVGSRTWLHHDNTQNTWRGEPMVDNLLRIHLCEQPRALALEEYVHYAGVLQGEALQTGIDNWRRRKWDSAAAAFWMFNDTWPAVTSWTTVDFYRRRKPSFWYVKRAFADLRAICVELDEDVAVFVVNDLREPRKVTLRYGLFALAGGRPLDERIELEAPANAAVIAARFPLRAWREAGDRTHGAFALLTPVFPPSLPATGHGKGSPPPPSLPGRGQGEGSPPPPSLPGRGHGEGPALQQVTSTHRLFRVRFKDLAWAPATVRWARADGALRLTSDTFAWAVCLARDGERPLADNYFDLIPGIEVAVPWPTELGEPARVEATRPPRVGEHRRPAGP